MQDNNLQLNKPVIEINGLWKIFGRKPKSILKTDLRDSSRSEIQAKTGAIVAIKNATLSINQSELFVVMGLSGSGKSTLIRCLLRLIEPTAGSILINGRDICRLKPGELRQLRRDTVGMVFQHFGLFPHRTVLDNVMYGLKVKGVKAAERKRRADEVIQKVGLKGWESYLPGALSGGMQQRVGIARALANDPEILLLDEPFSGLDPLIRRQMQDELLNLQNELKKTIVFVTHDLNEALKLGNRIAIMKDGEVIQVGTPEEVITSPANGYVREFVQDASLAKVITAGSIMEQPPALLHPGQTPAEALHLLTSNHMDAGFVLDKSGKLIGIATVEKLYSAYIGKDPELLHTIENGVSSSSTQTVLETLIPLATGNKYPIAVVDEQHHFLGMVTHHTLMSSLVQTKSVVTAAPEGGKVNV